MVGINGRDFTESIWGQLIERRDEWIGGRLVEYEGGFDSDEFAETEIVDFILRPNDIDSAWFEVRGEDFSCGFDVRYGGVHCGDGHPKKCLPLCTYDLYVRIFKNKQGE